MPIVIAAVQYFALTYVAGFVFGSLREWLIVPRAGTLIATLIETPVMLTVTYFAAQWIVGRFEIPPSSGERLLIGGIAFLILMIAEVVLSGFMRGWSVEAWVAHFKTPDGAISLAMFVLFGLMPWIVRH